VGQPTRLPTGRIVIIIEKQTCQVSNALSKRTFLFRNIKDLVF